MMGARAKRIRALGVDDLEAALREALEAYDAGWEPHMFIPAARRDRMERIRRALDGEVVNVSAGDYSIDWSKG